MNRRENLIAYVIAFNIPINQLLYCIYTLKKLSLTVFIFYLYNKLFDNIITNINYLNIFSIISFIYMTTYIMIYMTSVTFEHFYLR